MSRLWLFLIISSRELNGLKIFHSGMILDPTPTLVKMNEKTLKIHLHESVDTNVFEERNGRSACSESTKKILNQTFNELSRELKTIFSANQMQDNLRIVAEVQPLFSNDEAENNSKAMEFKSSSWTNEITTNQVSIYLNQSVYEFTKIKPQVIVSDSSLPILIEFSPPILTFNFNSSFILTVKFSTTDLTKFLVTTLEPSHVRFETPFFSRIDL